MACAEAVASHSEAVPAMSAPVKCLANMMVFLSFAWRVGLSRLKRIPGGSPGGGIGFFVITAIDAEVPLAEGRVDKMAMVGTRRIGMGEGREIATGHAHALDNIHLLRFADSHPSRSIAMVWRRSSAMAGFLARLARVFADLPPGLLAPDDANPVPVPQAAAPAPTPRSDWG